MITTIGEDRWLVGTPNCSYLVGVDGDLLVQLYWGPRIEPAEAAQVAAAQKGTQVWGPDHGQSVYAGWGGLLRHEPAVKARFANGTRTTQLKPVASETDGSRLTIHLRDDGHPFEVALHFATREDSDVIERSATIRALGNEPVWVDRAFSGTWVVPRLSSYRLSKVFGRWGVEAQLERTPLAHGTTRAGSRIGLTSHLANPWVMVDGGDATESAGDVYGVALAWSGSWALAVERDDAEVVRISGGFDDFDFGYQLAPGEELETPVLAGLHSAHGFGGASRAWHDYIRRQVLPRTVPRPVLYNSWEATAFAVSETGQAELARKAAAIGAELFVVDDGWFGIRDDDRSGLGDWQVDQRKFPNGLKPLVEEVRRLGMEFGIWVEPEMVNPDSDLYRAHPDWVISFPDRDRSEIRNQCMVNYARSDVREWAFGWLDALVRDHGIAFLKWDHNRYVTEPGWSAYQGDDPQRFWVAHTSGVYDVIDRLRAANPELQIESCAGGGGRVDLGILRRTEQFWTSDNTDALDRLTIQHGTSQIYPAIAMECWVTDSPNQQTGRESSLTYRCHVAMMGAFGIGADLTELSEAELAELEHWIEVYKSVRPTVQLGDQYRLASFDTDGFTAVGYVAADQAVLFVATGNISRQGATLPPIRLPGLDPEASYDVRHQVAGWSSTVTGRVLAGAGITVPPLRDRESEVVILSRM